MSNALEHIGRTQNRPQATSQATAIEQSRAIAEVQAMVTVAQRMPRDLVRAEAEMKHVCGRLSLAERAFYTVPNRGHGPSVHLAREMSRVWGNIVYGVHELRRDDEAGESEVQAFAWDLETNTRSTRTFIAPHARMKGGKRQALTDLNDIYLSNQNTGARAVRECIFTVLPTWFVEDAQNLCRRTLEQGEGTPLPDRIARMVSSFDGLGVKVAQLEEKTGKKRGQWTAGDVANLGIIYTSITRDGLDKDELFPSAAVSLAEISGKRKETPSEIAAEAATDQGDEPDEPPSDVEALWPETARIGGGA